jgi:hypothetical protein
VPTIVLLTGPAVCREGGTIMAKKSKKDKDKKDKKDKKKKKK